jgi:four helix bundle protein
VRPERIHTLPFLTRGSLLELETQLLLAIDLGYVQPADAAGTEGEIVEVQKMAAAIQRKLEGWIEGVREEED